MFAIKHINFTKSKESAVFVSESHITSAKSLMLAAQRFRCLTTLFFSAADVTNLGMALTLSLSLHRAFRTVV